MSREACSITKLLKEKGIWIHIGRKADDEEFHILKVSDDIVEEMDEIPSTPFFTRKT